LGSLPHVHLITFAMSQKKNTILVYWQHLKSI